jgi:hypothetical protein
VYVDAQLGGTRHGIFCSAGQNCDNSDFGYRLGVGYWFNEYVAVEYAYLNFGKSTASGFNAVPGQLTVEERKADAMGLYAVGRWPINAFGFHAKLGLVDGRVRRSSGIGSAGGVEFKTTSTYLMGGLGASYDFAPNWRAIAEWSRARVDLGAERPNFDLYAVGVQFRF